MVDAGTQTVSLGLVPWYPQRIQDLDIVAHRFPPSGRGLHADHPGSSDPIYRARRKHFAEIAYNYRHGQTIPYVDYTDEEKRVWSCVYSVLSDAYPKYACWEHNNIFRLLQQDCGFSKDDIPQLNDVSKFLKAYTGFTLRPTAGALLPRDVLNGLAFRVWHCTQYIRHHSRPFLNIEPDICHDLLGHVPLLADPGFAQLLQEFGMASIGASDDFIKKLQVCFCALIEFGLIQQNEELKACGAGLLSSWGELPHSVSGKADVRVFTPLAQGMKAYAIDKYQPVYFKTTNFLLAKEQIMRFSCLSNKRFVAIYNENDHIMEYSI